MSNINNPELYFGLYSVKPTEIKDLPDNQVLTCKTIHQAYRLAFNNALVKRPDEEWAELLGTTGGNFSALLSGKYQKHIPNNWITEAPLITGNNAVGQWASLYPKHKLRIQEIEQKEKELQDMKAAI